MSDNASRNSSHRGIRTLRLESTIPPSSRGIIEVGPFIGFEFVNSCTVARIAHQRGARHCTYSLEHIFQAPHPCYWEEEVTFEIRGRIVEASL